MVDASLVTDRERLGGTFDQAAELYQDARPEYPDALFERLVEAAKLRRGDRVLEVGPGPGKATIHMVRRGLQVTAVEPGAALAAQARANLAGHPFEVVNRRFEDWNAQPGEFAAVVAATVWHWLDPDLRYGRAARALRPDGHLAIWSAQHVFPVGGDPFFEELQEVYDQIGEAPPEGAPRPAPGELPEMTDEIRASGLFQMVSVDHFNWTVDYTAETYIDLLRTFSGHIAMAPADRDRLFSEIRRRVALRPGGTVRRGWGTVLHIARKL
jgi:SAM-dependent methyltransferase